MEECDIIEMNRKKFKNINNIRNKTLITTVKFSVSIQPEPGYVEASTSILSSTKPMNPFFFGVNSGSRKRRKVGDLEDHSSHSESVPSNQSSNGTSSDEGNHSKNLLQLLDEIAKGERDDNIQSSTNSKIEASPSNLSFSGSMKHSPSKRTKRKRNNVPPFNPTLSQSLTLSDINSNPTFTAKFTTYSINGETSESTFTLETGIKPVKGNDTSSNQEDKELECNVESNLLPPGEDLDDLPKNNETKKKKKKKK